MTTSGPPIPVADDIRSLLPYAVLAPSSHNTQPWRFRIADKHVSLYADRTRALPANDPDDRELTISCGCALMNLRVAAAQAGLATNIHTLPDRGDDDLLAVVDFNTGEEAARAEADLFDAIPGRRTYRKRFESRAVPEAVLQELSDAASTEGAWLHIVSSEDERSQVSTLVTEGDAVQWANPSWRRELAAWMHPRRRGDGLAVPGLVAPVAQIVVRTFDMGNGVGAKDRQLADESPILAVLGTDRDGVVDWLHAGQALERVLLKAHCSGLQASFLNQPIQVASLRPKLQHVLGLGGFPQILLRMGFTSEELPPAPRRDLAEVIE